MLARSCRHATLVAALALVFVAMGCTKGDQRAGEDPVIRESPTGISASPRAGTPSPTSSTIVGAAGTPPLWYGDSMRAMVEAYDTIVVGRVDGVAEIDHFTLERPWGGTAYSHPRTVFNVTVTRTIASTRVGDGDIIRVLQPGGPTPDGTIVGFEGDPRLDEGETYLFFVRDSLPGHGEDRFSGSAFGRFLVDGNGTIIPNGWEALPGVSAVSGLSYADLAPTLYADDPEAARKALARTTVDEAASKLLAAIAEAPLPKQETIATPVPPQSDVPAGDDGTSPAATP